MRVASGSRAARWSPRRPLGAPASPTNPAAVSGDGHRLGGRIPRRRIGIPALGWLLLTAGCLERNFEPEQFGDQYPADVLSHDSLSPVPITSRVLTESDEIGHLGAVRIVGEVLVVSDWQGPPFVHVLDRRSGRRLYSFGQRGQGPGDFQYAPRIVDGAERGDSLVWLLDNNPRRLTLFNAAGLAAGRIGPLAHRLVRIVTLEGWAGNVLVRPRAILANAHDSAAGRLFSLYRDDGKLIRRLGALAPEDNRYRFGKGEAYAASQCAPPSGDRLVLAYQYAGRIDIVDTLGGLITPARVPFPYLPASFTHPYIGGMAFKGGMPMARDSYQACAATDRFIYAVFEGKRHGNRPREPVPYSHVHVFDWTGNLVRVLRLDHRAVGIAVSRDSVMYTTRPASDSTGPQIRVARLE